MTYKKYCDEDLRAYLLSHAEIRAFYITCFDRSGIGLISYFDNSGKAWSLMEDDDTLVADAIEFLKKSGAPVFSDIDAVQEFENQWGQADPQ
jgi:hypothetical protein